MLFANGTVYNLRTKGKGVSSSPCQFLLPPPKKKKSFVRLTAWIYLSRQLLSYAFIEVSLPRHSTSITTEMPELGMGWQLLLYGSYYNRWSIFYPCFAFDVFDVIR